MGITEMWNQIEKTVEKRVTDRTGGKRHRDIPRDQLKAEIRKHGK